MAGSSSHHDPFKQKKTSGSESIWFSIEIITLSAFQTSETGIFHISPFQVVFCFLVTVPLADVSSEDSVFRKSLQTWTKLGRLQDLCMHLGGRKGRQKNIEQILYGDPQDRYRIQLLITEGSLEVKLPTIWTHGKAEVGRVREGKRGSEKLREEKESEERRCRCTKR